MRRIRSIAVLAAIAALTACGGGGVHPSSTVPAAGGAASGINQLLNAPHNAAPARNAGQAHVTITVPFARQTAATRRRPHYVTSYTAGIEIEAVQDGVPSGFQFVSLGANAPGCTVAMNSAGFTCTFSLAAPVGQTQILVGTFDSPNQGQGNLLSVASPTVTIQPGIDNVIPITTLPIAANIQPVSTPPRCVVVGTSVNLNTTYTAYDADGGDLTGLTLGNAISVTNVNPADSPSGYGFTPSTFTSGSGSLAFTYNGTDTNIGAFTITSSLAPDGHTNEYSGILGAIPVASAGPHMVYVADSGNNQILGYDTCSDVQQSPLIYSLPAGTNPVEVRFDRSSTALDPRLFVLSQALNQLVWLDVANAPGTVKQTLTFGGTPHHVNDSSTSAYLWVTIGSTTFKKFAIDEATPALTAIASPPPITSLNAPRGFGFGGAGNDILVANTGAGTLQAVNPSTMVTDGFVSIAAAPSKVSGPNVNASCALATSSTPNSVYAVSIVGAGGTPALIGSPIGLPGTPVAQQYFPPTVPNSGTIGFGTITGIIATTNAGAQLVTCDGSTFAASAFWPIFMTQPAAMVSSEYASLAVGGLIYVTGMDNGQPVLQAFTSTYDHDLGSVYLPSGATPTDVTVGP